ncbi:MAG TPA: hypothetical protein VHQ92_01150 [Pseudolabrys sp.]|jgi:hypothetical protein|nr:hypothetical protein [Pseudolabrys sp.]
MSDNGGVKTITIGDTAFYIRKMDPFAALKVFGDLQRDILPAAGLILQSVFGEGGVRGDATVRETIAEAAAEKGMADALTALSSRLDGNSLIAWANRLLDPDHIAVTINGRDAKLTADVKAMAFRDPGDILELMAEVIRYNFGDFLVRWAGRFGPALSKLAPPSGDSPKT